MPYAPSVNDRSGEILGNAGTNAAQIRAQGSVAAAQSVSDAITNISNMYMKKQEQNKQDTAKLESSMATGQAMMNLSQQYGTEGETFRQSLGDALNKAGNNPDKIAGATAAHMTYFDNMMAKDKTKAQYEALGNVYAGRAEATAAAKAALPPKYDFNYATEFNKALYDNGITDPEQRKQKFNEAGIGHLYDKFINPPKQNMGFFGPITQ